MSLDHTRIFGATLLLALTACTSSRTDMNAVNSSSADHGDATTRYRNPAPKEAYTITMTLNGAPGPFAFMKGLAQYDVVNRECLSPPKDNPGGHTAPVPTDDVEIPLRKISDTEYVATVYADQMLDQEFAGRGLCHWKLIQFRVHMKAKEEKGLGQMIPSITGDKLLSAGSMTIFFNKMSYSYRDVTYEPLDFGDSDRSKYGPGIKDSDLFTVTFSSERGSEQ